MIVLQTGLRAMDARKKFRFRKQTKAATIIQVDIFMCYHTDWENYFVLY